MRRTVFCALTAVLMTGTAAVAADPYSPIYSGSISGWDGIYGGLGLTYEGWSNAASGVGIVATVGGNATFDMFLIGIEVTGAAHYWFDGTWSGRFAFGPRAGILVTDDVLVYASTAIGWDNQRKWLGEVGAGVEFMVADQLSLDLGYDFVVDLDTPDTYGHRLTTSALWHF